MTAQEDTRWMRGFSEALSAALTDTPAEFLRYVVPGLVGRAQTGKRADGAAARTGSSGGHAPSAAAGEAVSDSPGTSCSSDPRRDVQGSHVLSSR
jgi:hypothetical protein